MTIIAGFTWNSTAALVGDILASSQFEPSVYIPVPTIEDPEQKLWEELGYAAGLFQKLAFVSPYLCVAWSGGREAAARVVDELTHLSGAGPVPKAPFLEYMDQIPNDSQTRSPSLIILAIYDDGEVELVARNAREVVKGLPSGMRAFCAGAGWRDAADLLIKRGALRESGSPTEIALSLAHKLAGTFHQRESPPGPNASRQNPLRMGAQYGAGFQVAILRNGRIEPEAHTTLQFWRGDLAKTGIFRLHSPTLFIRRDYQNGLLILRSARVHQLWSRCTMIPHDDQFCVAVPRVNEEAAKEPQNLKRLSPTAWPALTSAYEGQVIRVMNTDGRLLIITALQHPRRLHHHTTFFLESGKKSRVFVNSLSKRALELDLQREFASSRFSSTVADL